MLGISKKKKQKIINEIHGFDYISFRLANEDLADYTDSELDHYLQQKGLDELSDERRKFHKDFPPYNEEKYLEQFVDLRDAMEAGILESAFHHFKLFGYHEIITGQREWYKKIDKKSSDEQKEEVADSVEHFFIENVLRQKIYQEFIDILDINKYLEINTDIANAIENKTLESVDVHFRAQGLQELYSGQRTLMEGMSLYNEESYLLMHDDLKEQVEKKQFISGFEHFLLLGYHEILRVKRENERTIELEVEPAEVYLISDVLRKNVYQQFLSELNRVDYLKINSDLLLAIENGTMKNIDTHFCNLGLEELYSGSRILMEGLDPYNETVYLSLNRDLEGHFSKESFISGFEHYLLHGYKEVLSNLRLMKLPEETKVQSFDSLSLNQVVIEQSGLFDDAFYQTRYSDIVNGNVDPLSHYIMYGAKEGRDPHETFSTSYYVSQYPDVQNSGINPLVHYILVGQTQGRKTQKRGIDMGNMEFYHLPLVDKPLVDYTMKIAVVIHAFYIDVLEDIISSIDHILPRPDLFISVAEDANIEQIEAFLSDRGYMNFTIKAVQNRGRDVAPFLIEFSDVLKSYDLCCKIHGKKSLYSGSEQTDWRNHLYYNLLGNKEIVDDIIGAFSQDEKLGLLFSDNYGMLPYWGYSWLTNKGAVDALLQKLQLQQLAPLLDQTYIDYPAGNMFWFRPKAISQILDAAFRYEDFPEEPIANDGTIAHGLERLFGYVARLNGYDYIEQNRKLMQYTKNVTHKNFNQHQAKTLDTAKRIVTENEYVIFDIFDTLVTRTIFYPDNIFRILEERMDEKFDLRSNFMQIRKETENALRQAGHDGDVSYEDIYDSMHLYSDYTPEMISYIRELDFACELKILKSKPEVVELLKYAHEKGIKVLFVSDMYLTKAQVIRILSSNDIPFEEENLLVSSDTGYRKDNTTIWKYLIENKIIVPEKTLIIGDNEVSDAKIPGDFAIQSFHLLSERNNFFESPFGKAFTGKFTNVSQRDMILLGPIVNQIFASPFNLRSTLLDFTPKLSPYAFGYTALAPFFYLFLSNLYQKYSADHIYFLARDGYFIKEVFEHFIQSKNLNPKGKIHYLEISRRAVLGAVKKDKENLKNMILDLGDYNGKMSDMIYSRVGLSAKFLKECDIDDFVLSTHEDMEISYTLLVDNLDIINAHTQAEQEAFIRYLKSIGFFDDKKDVIVDLGYSGTIQNYLHQITNKHLVGEYFVTTEKVSNIENKENILNGYFAHKIDPKDMSNNIIYKYALILEGYLTSDKGQLICFEEQAGKAIPRYKVKKSGIEVQRDITRGIKDYISDLSIVPVDFIDVQSDTNKEIALFSFEYMLKYRKLSEELLSIFHLEDEFTGVEKLDIMAILNQRGL